jgi:hypothetical protein
VAISFDAAGATEQSLARPGITFRGTESIGLDPMRPAHELLGCTADAALFHGFDTAVFVVCADTCRHADAASLTSTTVATVAGGKVHAIRTRDRVVGVWTEGKPPRFFATDKAMKATLASSNGKVIDVLGETEDGVVVVRLPL